MMASSSASASKSKSKKRSPTEQISQKEGPETSSESRLEQKSVVAGTHANVGAAATAATAAIKGGQPTGGSGSESELSEAPHPPELATPPPKSAASNKRGTYTEPLSIPEAFTRHIRATQNLPPVPKNLLDLLSEEVCSTDAMLDALSSSGESIAYADELALVEDMIEYVVNYPDDALTLDQAMALIEHVARADSSTHERLVAHGAVAAVFVCMARGAVDPDIQDWGCAAVWNMAYLPQHEANLLENNAPVELTRSMALFPTVPSLQERGCGALVAIACSPEGQAAVRAAEGLSLFLQRAQTEDQPSVQRWACAGLAVCIDEESLPTMIDEGVIPTALGCLRSTLDQATVAYGELRVASLELLHALAKFPASRSRLISSECLTTICESMRNDKSAAVHAVACNALALLVDTASLEERRTMMAADVSDALQLALETHTDAALHARVRRALAILSGSYTSYTMNMLRSLFNRWMLA
eukprot:m.69865 g.69865  ORF g.69865 m.69865 type:complete len:474 (+) comp12853_c0_seq1:33-1454(+)